MANCEQTQVVDVLESPLFYRRRAQPWLGTLVEITVVADDFEQADRAIDAGFEAIQLVHASMSFHDKQSELSKLNQSAHLQPQQVCTHLYKVLAFGAEICKRSNGAFDYTIAATLVERGYLPDHGNFGKLYGCALDLVFLDNSYVFFDRPLCVDLGGIAKGYAVDLALERMQDFGVTQIVINAGGDLKVFSSAPVPIAIRSPADPSQFLPALMLFNQAAATSASYGQAQNSAFEAGSRLINPITQKELAEVCSVTVVAESCMLADALTKAFLFAPDASRELFEVMHATSHFHNVRGWAVDCPVEEALG